MTDWRKQQGQGRFRNVPFYTETGERSGGRQVTAHSFPFSEAPPFAEDLGLKPRKFTIDAYVLGTEYTTARDALLTELEKPGPGELVHPYYGTRRVAVESFRVRETRDRGGMAQITIEFIETVAKPANPSTVVDAKASVTASAETLQSAAVTQFEAAYSAFSTLRSSAVRAIRGVTNGLNAVVERVALEAQALADLTRQITELSNTASGLANAPEDLAAGFVNVFEALGDALVVAADPSGILLSLFNLDLGIRPPESTPNREQERANYDAIKHLVQRLVLVRSAAAVITQTFTSYDEAVSARGSICDALDTHVEEVSDDTYAALTQLRADLVRAVPGDDGDLPRLQSHTPFASVPSLVLAHRLYGNLDREEDLVLRNGVKNPGFIPGGVALEVLSD